MVSAPPSTDSATVLVTEGIRGLTVDSRSRGMAQTSRTTRLRWLSSDSQVATVSNTGSITARQAGTAFVTVSTPSGLLERYAIVVVSPSRPLSPVDSLTAALPLAYARLLYSRAMLADVPTRVRIEVSRDPLPPADSAFAVLDTATVRIGAFWTPRLETASGSAMRAVGLNDAGVRAGVNRWEWDVTFSSGRDTLLTYFSTAVSVEDASSMVVTGQISHAVSIPVNLRLKALTILGAVAMWLFSWGSGELIAKPLAQHFIARFRHRQSTTDGNSLDSNAVISEPDPAAHDPTAG
jgi:hypothetical protein